MKALAVTLAFALAAVGLSLAAPVAAAEVSDVCLSYWFCVVNCVQGWIHNTYCACAPECPPRDEPW